jgi:hypothetical protein
MCYVVRNQTTHFTCPALIISFHLLGKSIEMTEYQNVLSLGMRGKQRILKRVSYPISGQPNKVNFWNHK